MVYYVAIRNNGYGLDLSVGRGDEERKTYIEWEKQDAKKFT